MQFFAGTEEVSAQGSPVRLQRGRRIVQSLLLIACLGFAPTTAHAYRTFADDPSVGYPARWEVAPIDWYVWSDGGVDQPTSTDLREAAQRAFASWATIDCAAIETGPGTITSQGPVSGDGRNTIALVSHDWLARGLPGGDRGASTDIRLESRDDGTVRIVEADIYLNADSYQFVLGSPESGQLDLQAVLTHEIGHALGFLHICEDDGSGGAPACGDPSLQESALYPDYLGESARTLGADDIEGACFLYPDVGGCDATCPVDTVCQAGRCVDPACGAPFCPDGCVGAGCDVGRCAADSTCADGACALVGDERGYCVAEGSTGARCMRGDDCTSGLCLTSQSLGSYCTVECVEDAECGGVQHCAEVDGRNVCAPLPAQSGCTVAPPGRPDKTQPTAVCVLFLATLLHLQSRRSR